MFYEQPGSPDVEEDMFRQPSCSSGLQKYRTALSCSGTSLASFRDLPVVSIPSSCCMSRGDRSPSSYCAECGRRDGPAATPPQPAAPPINLNVNIYMNASKMEDAHIKIRVDTTKATSETKGTQYEEQPEMMQNVFVDLGDHSPLASALSGISELLRECAVPECARSASEPITFEQVESVGAEFVIRPETITGLQKPSRTTRAGVTGPSNNRKDLRWQYQVFTHEIVPPADPSGDVGVQVDASCSSSDRSQVPGSLYEPSQCLSIKTPLEQVLFSSQTTPMVPPRRRPLRRRSPNIKQNVQPTDPDLFNVMSTTPPDDNAPLLGLVEDVYHAFSDN